MSRVQFCNLNGKIHCTEKPATQDPDLSLLLEEERGASNAKLRGPLRASVHCVRQGAWTRPLRQRRCHGITHAQEEAKQKTCHLAKHLYITRVGFALAYLDDGFTNFQK